MDCETCQEARLEQKLGAPVTEKQQAWLRSMFQSQSTLPSPLPGSSGTAPPTSVAAPPVSLATVNTSGELTYVCIGVCTNPSRGQLQHRPRGTGSPAGTGACAKLHGARIAHRAPGTRPYGAIQFRPPVGHEPPARCTATRASYTVS